VDCWLKVSKLKYLVELHANELLETLGDCSEAANNKFDVSQDDLHSRLVTIKHLLQLAVHVHTHTTVSSNLAKGRIAASCRPSLSQMHSSAACASRSHIHSCFKM